MERQSKEWIHGWIGVNNTSHETHVLNHDGTLTMTGTRHECHCSNMRNHMLQQYGVPCAARRLPFAVKQDRRMC